MVPFLGQPQLRLFVYLCLDFGVDFVLISRLICDSPMAGLVVRFGAVMAYFETVLAVGPVACV